MNIAMQFNKKYLLYAEVMLTSLCTNNDKQVDIYILNSELESRDIDVLKESLRRFDANIYDLKVDRDIFDMRLPVCDDWPIEMYYKILLPELLPDNVDRILFLDVDIIVNGPLTELYDIDFGNKDMYVAQDGNGCNVLSVLSDRQQKMFSKKFGDNYKYFNSGVMLMNIERLRSVYSFEDYKNAMEVWEYDLVAPDQDLINYVHGDKVGFVDWEIYDLFAQGAHMMGMTYNDVKDKARIIHFGGSKPWNSKMALHFDIEKLWWDYAELTPHYKELASDFIISTVNNPGFETIINETFEENRKLKELLEKAQDLLRRIST